MKDNYSTMSHKDATSWMKSNVSSSVHFDQPGPLTYKDVLVQQILSIADTDAIANEVTNRMVPGEDRIVTGLESLTTTSLLDELTGRASCLALILIQAQQSMQVGETILSLGNIFPSNPLELDGYRNIASSSIDDGDKDPEA